MTYIPNPLDTSDVRLPDSLAALTEALAKNTHENWAAEKMSHGWVYGDTPDHQRLRTPDLIPYEELSEEKKEYDRRTALETLKLILKMGYVIVPPEAGGQ